MNLTLIALRKESKAKHTYMPVCCTNGSSFYVNLFNFDHFLVLNEVVGGKVYEGFFTPQKGDIVVDAGAHIGAFSVRSARFVGPTGMVIAFEPNPDSFHLLRKNIELNGIRNVLLANSALGKDTRSGHIAIDGAHTRIIDHDINYKSVSAKIAEVDIVPLDVYCEGKIPRVDFLKIDVEGSELEVLEGAEKTITENKMRIAIEVHSKRLLSEIRRYLTAKGYKTWSIVHPFWRKDETLFLLSASNKTDDFIY